MSACDCCRCRPCTSGRLLPDLKHERHVFYRSSLHERASSPDLKVGCPQLLPLSPLHGRTLSLDLKHERQLNLHFRIVVFFSVVGCNHGK